MKKAMALLTLVVLAGCEVGDGTAQSPSDTVVVEAPKPVKLEMLEGYFVKNDAPIDKKDPTKVIVRNQDRFDEYFAPAKTKDNVVSKLDFSVHQVGALILPPDMYEHEIEVVSATEEAEGWTVAYRVIQGPVRTFESTTLLMFKVPMHIKHLEFLELEEESI